MGRADVVTKDYLKDPEVFADACNFVFGKEKVKASELTRIDETETVVPRGKGDPFQKSRDSMYQFSTVMEDGRAVYVLIGGENQTDVHYAMPVRNMGYDFGRYQAQVNEIARKNKSVGEFKDSGEFLSGLKPSDKLLPVITIVIYYGDKPWDGARSLYDMLEIQDEEFLP